MNDRRLEALLRLNCVPKVEPERLWKLLDAHEPEEALTLTPRALAAVVGGSEDSARRLLETARAFDAEAELAECERRAIHVIATEDPRYPKSLRDLGEGKPLLLYAQGDPTPPDHAAAVVGTRTPTPYGERIAKRLGHDLAVGGLCVVSGMARGIDTSAHEGALAAQGRTWAFLGSGLKRPYPPENEPLARRIVEAGGCLLTEHPLSEPPDKYNFPRRNRLIAALGFATVVVESWLKKSGSMETAALAQGLGRDLFAVPGPVDVPANQGPLKLLKEGGAALACSAEDVLALLPPEARLAARCQAPAPKAASAKQPALSSEYSKILQFLESDTRTADQLAVHAGLDVPRLSNILFELELQGLIVPLPGQRYGKKDKIGS